MAIEARYFDGETARDYRVNVSLDANGIAFVGDGVASKFWNLAGVGAIDTPTKAMPFASRLTFTL